MPLPGFMTTPWWLCTGAVCALAMAVSIYRSHMFEPAPGNVHVWREAIFRTVHVVTVAVILLFTFVAWPIVVLVLAYNLYTTRREAIENDQLDRIG